MVKIQYEWARPADGSDIQVRGWNSDALSRLKTVVDGYGGPKMVSVATGIPLTTLHSALRGVSDPRSSMLAAIAEVTGQSIDWIMFGKAPVGGQSQTQRIAATSISVDLASVPYYNVRASAGPGSMPLDEEPKAMLAVDRLTMRMLGVSPANAAFLTVHGDSGEPNLSQGDGILIDRSMSHLRDGGLFVIGIDGDVMVKRVERQADRSVLLKSDNPSYSTQHVSAADAEHLRVIGRVRWAFRAL